MSSDDKPCNCKEENKKNLSRISEREQMAKQNTKQVEVRYIGNARRVAVNGVGILNNGEWVKVREDIGLNLAGQKSFELRSKGGRPKNPDPDPSKEEEVKESENVKKEDSTEDPLGTYEFSPSERSEEEVS